MSDDVANTGRLKLAELSRSGARQFSLKPDAAALAGLRDRLDLLGLRKVRLEGEIEPRGSRDWHLTARLGATVQQPCVITLAPVTTRIEAEVERRYLADWQPPNEAEAEMDEDDGIEPLPLEIDLNDILEEELALALPLYPRAEGAEFDAADDGEEEEDRVKPFAGLAALKDRMEGDGSS